LKKEEEHTTHQKGNLAIAVEGYGGVVEIRGQKFVEFDHRFKKTRKVVGEKSRVACLEKAGDEEAVQELG